jgi:hypothetical protein
VLSALLHFTEYDDAGRGPRFYLRVRALFRIALRKAGRLRCAMTMNVRPA